MELKDALHRIEVLEDLVHELTRDKEELVRQLRAAVKDMPGALNPVYAQLIRLMIEEPRTIKEYASEMGRDNRSISQYFHALKVRFGAEISVTSDGRRRLENPEIFADLLRIDKLARGF